ncbi:SAM-dependent DNA methyltransferase, partial [Rhizobium leguminosarum]
VDVVQIEVHQQQAQRARHLFHAVEGLALLEFLFLFGEIDSDHVDLGDTLSDKGKGLGRANIILTNPPFGPAGGAP